MNKKRNSILISLLLIVVPFAFTVFVVIPYVRSLFKDAEILSEKKQELAILQAQVQYQKEFTHVVSLKESDIHKLSALFLDPGDPIRFLRFLEETADRHALTIVTVPGIAQKEERDLWPSIVFQISSEGSFPRFVSFVRDIEHGPYLMDMKGMNVIKEKESERVQFFLSLKIYTK